MPTATLVFSPQGQLEHAMYGVDDGESLSAHVEPGQAPALVEWLDKMRFMMRVEVTDVTEELAVVWRPAARIEGAPYSGNVAVPRKDLETIAQTSEPAWGMWAFEALWIAHGEPRPAWTPTTARSR